MKKIILISLLVMVVFFGGCVLFTPVDTEMGKITLWQSLVQR